jgi:ADP-heptose:LPS heptosyltransferase
MKSWFEHRWRWAPQPVHQTGRYRYVRWRWRALFALVDAVGWAIVRMLRARQSRKATRTRLTTYQRILLVQLDHMGDAILSLGLVKGLRTAFPAARIDILASSANAELFAACPDVDRVQIARVNRLARGPRLGWPLATLYWGWRLRRQRYDLAIDPRGEFPSAVMLWFTGAPVRLGWDCGGGGFLLTHRAAYIPRRHEVLSRQALLDCLGIEPPAGQPAWPPALERPSLRTGLIVLHPGAGTQAKRWPAEHWRELLGRLILEHNPQIALIGTEEERPLIDEILEHCVWPGVVNLCGQLSIQELTKLLASARLLIGSDSGPAHLAAAVETPVVVLFSGTNHAGQWRPWGEQVIVLRHETPCSPCHRQRCPLADHPCLTGLHPESVLAAVREMFVVPPSGRKRARLVTSRPKPELRTERTPA